MEALRQASTAAFRQARKPLVKPVQAPLAQLPAVLLCDLDGTLIDTMPTLAILATEVIHDVYGMDRALAHEMYISTCGLPFIQQLGVIFPGDSRNQSASDRFESEKPARCNHTRMAPDTREALALFRSHGVRVVVSSNNGQENVEAFASFSNFEFDGLLGFGNGQCKGRPHVETACVRFGVPESRLLFVGDSLHDGEIAKRESLSFVGVAGTFSREQFSLRFAGRYPVVDRFSGLADLFFAPGHA